LPAAKIITAKSCIGLILTAPPKVDKFGSFLLQLMTVALFVFWATGGEKLSNRREEIIARLKATLDPERFEHSLRVEKEALKLGKKWGVSNSLISPAALLHDCSRRLDRPGLLREARKLGISIDPVKRFEPKLFHAEISALIARREFGIKSRSVLQAIRRHTLGAEGMTKLDKVIYLADHIEEERDFKGINEMRKLSYKNLDWAIIASTSNMAAFLLENGLPIHPGTVQTRNYLILRQK
jgi:predicted HD superfamily hydrolase involved in NAD metabolism